MLLAMYTFENDNISIHAPHEGERQKQRNHCFISKLFQSTLPTRGATSYCNSTACSAHHFNPRSPRGGATLRYWIFPNTYLDFNPRSPRGGATRVVTARVLNALISIHAPHEGERPPRDRPRPCIHQNFNPRSPRGGATLAAQ